MRLKTVSYSIGVLGLLLVLVAGGALDLITTRMMHGLLEHQGAQSVALATEKLKLHLRDTAHFNAFWTMTHNGRFLRERNQAKSDALNSYHELEATEQSTHNNDILLKSENTANSLFAAQERAPVIGNKGLSLEIIAPLSRLLDHAIAPLDELSILKEAEAAAAEARNRDWEKIANWIARSTEIVSVFLFMGIVWFLHFNLIVPIRILINAVLRYKEGDREARVTLKQLKIVEIVQSAHAFNDLADRLNDMERRRLQYLVETVHDIRNPLTVLKTAATILRLPAEKEISPRAKKLLQVINEQIDLMSHLVDNYIETQQVQSGRIKLKEQEVDISAIVDEVVRLWQVASKGHFIVYVSPEAPLMVRCDPTRIQQSLNNLMSNAIKYSPDGGPINVAVESEGESVRISVSDRGLGISPEDREKIFEPFRRSAAVRDLIPGTGLGLSSAMRIVEAHGGSIEVESKTGIGSTFRIRIPRMGQAKKVA